MIKPKKTVSNTTIADKMPGLVTIYSIPLGKYTYVNNSVTTVLGYKPKDFLNGGIEFMGSLIHPEDLPEVELQNNKALVAANTQSPKEQLQNLSTDAEYRMKHKKGHWIWVHTELSAFSRNEDGEVAEVLSISTNVTERKEQENQIERLKSEFEILVDKQNKEIQDREKMFRSLIEVVEDYAIFRLDTEGKIRSWNEGVGKILGYTEEEIIGQPTTILFAEDDKAKNLHIEELEKAKSEGTTIQEGIRLRKDGSTFFATVTITPIWDEQGVIEGYSKIIKDVTELKQAEEKIRYHASHDTLTGLANRNSLDEYFTMSKASAIRHGNKMAIIFLDLDRFKTINDTLGHGVGDLLLKEVADRLRSAVRNIDLVARLGGDEFIILVNEVKSAQNVARVANKIIEALLPITRIQDQSLHVTCSMGIAMFPADGQDIFSLLKNSDTALYRAKDAGRNRYQFYDYSMNMQSGSMLSLEQDLRTAVSENQLFMEYQPFTDIATGRVMGVEALVRWNHPKLGILHPFDFIPLAEETGMIVHMGEWIFKTVCEDGKRLRELGYPLKMTVNLSGRQFSENKLVDKICTTLEETGFDANDLEIEITESIAMENVERTSSKLESLKELGISISIDDFGTGYSSLSYLKRFPVQKLKIDQSFVKHAITDGQDRAIIQAIISMAKSMGLTICAEGVESTDQLALLLSMECDYAQGYLISRPLEYDKLTKWLGQLTESAETT